MTNCEERLKSCLATVFPALPANEIPNACVRGVKEWDSAAAISLVMVIEEEFGVSLDFEAMAELDSFHKIAEYLKTL